MVGKENIRSAFLSLLETEPYARITVKEITAKAGISRTTFYRHYETREDVLVDIIDSVTAGIEQMRPRFASTPAGDELGRRALMYQVLQYVEENKDAIKVIMDNPGACYYLFSRVQRYLLDTLTTDDAEPSSQRERKLQARVRHYHADGIIAVVTDWVDHGCDDSISDLVDFILSCGRGEALRVKM